MASCINKIFEWVGKWKKDRHFIEFKMIKYFLKHKTELIFPRLHSIENISRSRYVDWMSMKTIHIRVSNSHIIIQIPIKLNPKVDGVENQAKRITTTWLQPSPWPKCVHMYNIYGIHSMDADFVFYIFPPVKIWALENWFN